MKMFGLKVSEDELKALIDYHLSIHGSKENYDIERSHRIHDLTKRLNKEMSEVENDARAEEEPKPNNSAW